MNTQKPTAFLSIDIECTGPNPYEHSILSIGCALFVEDMVGVYQWEMREFTMPLIDDKNRSFPSNVIDAILNKHIAFDPKTIEFWEKNKTAYDHIIKNGIDRNNTKSLRDQFVGYIEELQKKYNLFFIAAPTAYDLSYIIKHFNYDKGIPKQNWIDLFSFLAPILFFGATTPDQSRKIYLQAKKEAKAKANTYNDIGVAHCAKYDALVQGFVFESAYNKYHKIYQFVKTF